MCINIIINSYKLNRAEHCAGEDVAMDQNRRAEQPLPLQSAHEYYDLFGLIFESTENIPGIAPAGISLCRNAIAIEFGPVPHRIENVEFEDSTVRASGSEYLFTYPGVLRLYVEQDRRIVVERQEDCSPVRLWTFVLGVGASITGFRRGHIPLHASSILTEKGCIAFAGRAGAGKSTVAAFLINRGFELFTDDLCLIQWSGTMKPVVGRGVPELRLSGDSIAALDWTDAKPFAVQPNANKTVFRRAAPRERFGDLRRIYILEFTRDGAAPGIHRLSGTEALRALINCLRLRLGLLPTGEARRTFERLTAIGDKVEIFRFARPPDYQQSSYWFDRLIEHFES
jgi:hypothetical protein